MSNLSDDVNAALVALNRGGLTFERETSIPGLKDLDSAYQHHDPSQFPYAYGGAVNVKGTEGLFEYDIRTPQGRLVHLVVYNTKAGRIGFVLPKPGDATHNKIGILTSGEIEPAMITEIARQLTEQLKDPSKVHDYWC